MDGFEAAKLDMQIQMVSAKITTIKNRRSFLIAENLVLEKEQNTLTKELKKLDELSKNQLTGTLTSGEKSD